MALGLGFNKAKILQNAEKYVLQGKLSAAIAEYQKILKKDPKDLMTLNTVGDLYVRDGKMDEAVKCFYTLAEKSIEAGFVPRAIAVYKRITKIDPEAVPALTRLGELYSMQGLLRDARSHYLQAVEIHLRKQDPVKAREVFEKVLMLDLENPRLQRRMAELYAQTGKTAEAVSTFLGAAERFLEQREAAEAAATLDLLLKLEPENLEAQILRGRVLLEQGEPQKAIELLQPIVAQVAAKPALQTLFRAHLAREEMEPAIAVARQIFQTHGDFTALARAAEVRLSQNDPEGALRIYQENAEDLQSRKAFSVLIDGLKHILKTDASNIVALELLWGAYRNSGQVGEGRETAELLAHAYVSAGQLVQARDVYAELVALEPDVAEHQRLLKQVEARLGTGTAEAAEPATGEPTPLMALEVAAAPEEESSQVETLPPREQALVKNCLTESELYITYKQFSRAIETLEKGLRDVPGNLTLYEHLLPLYEQTQQYDKAAQCAEALTEIYIKAGDGERATRYGELIVSYQQKAEQASAETVVETTFDAETAPEEATPAAAAEQPQVREIDLSMEWASLAESGAPAAAPAADSLAEEIEFYLQAGLAEEAAASIARLREIAPEHPSLSGFETRLAALSPRSAEVVPPVPVEPASVAAEEPPVMTPEAAFGETAIAPVEEPALTSEPAPVAAEASAEPAPPPAVAHELVLEDVLPVTPPAPGGFELALEDTQAGAATPEQFASL
ncbi:MAG TPA: tetratricopeptide repeat protein, partial [Terriglobia bacterium]|nr:tetratricopeptide repeat protein [Terriglobia bacterium]